MSFHIMERSAKVDDSSSIPGTKALSTALDILGAFTDERPRWTLSRLATELNLPKSTAHRILSALERRGMLSRMSGEAEYRLGPKLIVLGGRALRAVDVRELARPELESISKRTGEDTSLECLVGWEVLLLHEERGQSILGLGSPVGTLWPAHATATGKVLLAHAREPLPEPPGGLRALTEHTIVSWDEWNATLSEIRERGFATNMEELEYGYTAIAAAVRDQTGRAVAAISIGGPIHRMGNNRLPELIDTLQVAAS
jgi:DNA-binding IclR family transcriptional regulator